MLRALRALDSACLRAQVPCVRAGVAHGLVVWWQLDMLGGPGSSAHTLPTPPCTLGPTQQPPGPQHMQPQQHCPGLLLSTAPPWVGGDPAQGGDGGPGTCEGVAQEWRGHWVQCWAGLGGVQVRAYARVLLLRACAALHCECVRACACVCACGCKRLARPTPTAPAHPRVHTGSGGQGAGSEHAPRRCERPSGTGASACRRCGGQPGAAGSSGGRRRRRG